MLIPPDDAALRAAAANELVTFERDNVSVGGGLSSDQCKNMLNGLSEVPARTPGGLAWKLATILSFFSTEEDWQWWRYLLQSAVHDAIELERVRAATAPSSAPNEEPGELGELLTTWRRLDEISETCKPDDLRDAAGRSKHHIAAAVIKLQSATMAGVMARWRLFAVGMGLATATSLPRFWTASMPTCAASRRRRPSRRSHWPKLPNECIGEYASMSTTITWGDDLRQAVKVMRRRRALRCTALVLGALLMFSAGALFERLAG